MKKLVNLSFIDTLRLNLSEKNALIQVLIGPRQVEKQLRSLTSLNQRKKGNLFTKVQMRFSTATVNGSVKFGEKAANEKKILVIDEIQKCENWAAHIKRLWDRNQKEKYKVQCILLGSSSLEIQKGLTESLTGRFQLIKAYHWNFSDSKLGYRVDFEEYLKYGGYPASYQFINKQEWLNYVKNSIVSTVIEKDILQYQNVKSPSLFKQAFEIIVSYPAQEISYTKLLGQIQDKGNVDLVKYYISLLEGAFLLKALEKYSEKKIKIKASSPKILPLAPCLYYLGILDNYKPEEKGRAFELVVGAQLVRTDCELYYWRDGVYEVDFVLKSGRSLFAIEVKSHLKKNSKGLSKFQEQFPAAKSIFITFENYFEFEKGPLTFLKQYAK